MRIVSNDNPITPVFSTAVEPVSGSAASNDAQDQAKRDADRRTGERFQNNTPRKNAQLYTLKADGTVHHPKPADDQPPRLDVIG